MIVVDEGMYFYVLWFVGCKTQDMMGTIYKEDKSPGKVFASYRFRYYRGDDVFDSNDKKNWYVVTAAEDNVQKLIESFKFITDEYAEWAKAETRDWLVVNGDHLAMCACLMSQSWSYVKPEEEKLLH